jgi:hypothetical protein
MEMQITCKSGINNPILHGADRDRTDDLFTPSHWANKPPIIDHKGTGPLTFGQEPVPPKDERNRPAFPSAEPGGYSSLVAGLILPFPDKTSLDFDIYLGYISYVRKNT